MIPLAVLLRADHIRRRLWPGLCPPPAVDGSDLPRVRRCADCPALFTTVGLRCRLCQRARRRQQNKLKERRYYERSRQARRRERQRQPQTATDRRRAYIQAKLRRYRQQQRTEVA